MHNHSFLQHPLLDRILVISLCLFAGLILGMHSYQPALPTTDLDNTTLSTPDYASDNSIPEISVIEYPGSNEANNYTENETIYVVSGFTDTVTEFVDPPWQIVRIKSGDNLSLIFDRLHIKPQELHKIISLGKETNSLKRLMPGQELRFKIRDEEMIAMEYDINLTTILNITKENEIFHAQILKNEIETRVRETYGTISHSLFLDATRAGLSDNLTMQLVNLYGWDIDFALDIRTNDRFYVIYEEKYQDNVKVKDGPILAAEFINQGKSFRAVRYTHDDGHIDYYSDAGFSMRKAFLRTPVNFTRISSGFSLSRKHPVLNTMRAHRGVDYAAPRGTPIKATGDGIVNFVGRNGGYGKVVILRHGGKYSTLYAHLSKYANGISRGKRVSQGQTIGYVGTTGLATGPHLHYEFRINDLHHNPLTVKLPKALGIPETEINRFNIQVQPLLARLDLLTDKSSKFAESGYNPSVVALHEEAETVKPTE